MKVRGFSAAVGGVVVFAAASLANGQSGPTTAKIEAVPFDLTAPDRYQIPAILEPIRRVTILAPADGILRSMEAPLGSAVRESQDIAQLDRAEASARLKIAQAHVKEMQASLKGAGNAAIVQAQLDGAQARAEIAQLELERCTLRAPFAGRLLAAPLSPGQYVTKGALVAELADVSSLRALVPLERSGSGVGASVTVSVEGQSVAAKVQASLPLPEGLAALRELSTAFTAAWVVISNPKGTFEPGQRVLSLSLPNAPIATIPAHALRDEEKGAPKVQVIRNEYATDVAVRVLGRPGADRAQVSGPLRKTDSLIVSSSVPIVAGTLIRFTGGGGQVEGTTPNPAVAGEVAGISPPRGAGSRAASEPAPAPRTKPAASRPAPTPTPF